ncbi:MAG TPA: IPT/TIG domain-containing protein [Candidatus Bathyarchaeia archaeon]|nr:IPT/TIG domain-containing protein [Candidatus Bathyarchaeia archaeon]
MPSDMRNIMRIAALSFLVLGLVGTASAQYAGGIPWHVDDVAVCFGDGTCNMLRVTGTNTVTLLDQFKDGLSGAAATNGAAINNSLHLLVTDAASGGSDIVEYSIASVNPSTGATVAHTPVTTFNGEGTNVLAVALNNAGDMYVLNNNSGSPTIVELNQNGVQVGSPISLTSKCSISSATSMDLSANGLSAWVTSGSTIQQVTLSNGTCTEFANLGPYVTLYSIKDIAPGGLASAASCKGATCPTDESLLVVATGVIDPPGMNYDICTDAPPSGSDSCGLLIDTNPNDPGLTKPLWQVSTSYALSTKILDPALELQKATTAGTSGTTKPPFSETGGTAIDNAVIWTNEGQPAWAPSNAYAAAPALPTPGTYIVDPNNNLQTVSIGGTSGPVEPNSTPKPTANPVSWSSGGMTIDGLQWQDQTYWQAGQTYQLGAAIGDSGGHPQTVLTAGTSGGSVPAFSNTTGAVTIDNAVIWTNEGAVGTGTWAMNTKYGQGYGLFTYITPNGHVQQAIEPGTSGSTMPVLFSTTGGQTMDGGVVWTDQGMRPWHPGYAFPLNALIVDPAGHVQQVTTAGASGPTPPAFNDLGSTTTDGLQWTDLGVPGSWSAGGSPVLNAVIVDSVTMHVQQVVLTGMSGGSAPAFSNTGGYTLDGTVVWLDQGAEAYQTNHPYSVGSAIFDGKDVQQALTAGTSGGTQPTFADVATTVTPDNAVVWTDEGALTWQPGYGYTASSPATTYIVDHANHLQKVTTAGTSGPAAPAFVDGGLTMNDGSVTWQDQGIRFWHANAYALDAVVVDAAGHLQEVTTAGTSGPTQPTFNDSGMTATDGLQWTDQGALASWAASSPFSLNQFIVDNSGTPHVQEVVVTGTSGASEGPFNTSGGLTIDGSVVWLDRGISTYQKNNPYSVGNAFSDGTDIQQATTAGTSGGSEPTFANVATTVTPDNAVVWTDEGTSAWAMNDTYAADSFIIDPAGHVQETLGGGTSGGSIPTFNDGGTVYDGLVWADLGPVLTWAKNTLYTASASYPFTLVIGGGYVQQATTTGISGTPNPPAWNATVSGVTVDGLQWTDQGQSIWAMNHLYSTLGTLISEQTAPYHAQKVYEAGTSGSSAPVFNHSGGMTIDNAVTWTESHPMWAAGTYTVGNSNTLILDTNNNVELVTNNNLNNKVNSTSGTTGPSQPTWNTTTGANPITGVTGTTVDGLVWTNQVSTPDSSVIARYPVAGVSTLESAALDPLVSNCLNNVCTTTPYPVPTIDNVYLYSNFSLPAAGFWLGDSNSPTFYRLDFATGYYGNSTYEANQSCNGCNTNVKIESLAVYGSEGSNQPDLAELFSGSLGTTAATDAETVVFLGNTLTASVYTSSNTPPTSAVPFALYASPVNPASDFSDSPAIPNGTPCTPTYPSTSPTTCIVWKSDVFSLAPPSGDYLSEKFAGPSAITTNTDVYTDMAFDTTIFVGNFDPGGKNKGSAEGLFTIAPTYSEAQSGCTYLSPAPLCYQPSLLPFDLLPFAFQCPKAFPGIKLDQLEPTLSIVQFYPNTFPIESPTTPTLKGPNGTTNYVFYSSFLSFLDVFAFDWITPAATTTQYYQACTFDTPQDKVATFCQSIPNNSQISFILSPSCLTNPWISQISPTSGNVPITITITGFNFAKGATVTFLNAAGEATGTNTTVHNPTTITTTVPANTPLGTVNVVVTNPGGLNYALANGFTNP